MKRDTVLATKVQRTAGFIPIKTVLILHLAVNEKSQKLYTQQVTKQALRENSCRVLHIHLPRYKLQAIGSFSNHFSHAGADLLTRASQAYNVCCCPKDQVRIHTTIYAKQF